MALSKRTVVDRIEILSSGIIQVRSADQIFDDEIGEVIAQNFRRQTLEPGDNDGARELLGDKAQVADLVWTPEVIRSHEAAKAAQNQPKQVEANEELSQAG